MDFLGIVAGLGGLSRSPVQIILGEAKTRKEIDAEDARKLGKLADAIPRDLAATYIMFSKTDAFSSDEVRIAKSLNSQFNHRVVLWSREELEPYFVYERSKDRLDRPYATSISDMVNITTKTLVLGGLHEPAEPCVGGQGISHRFGLGQKKIWRRCASGGMTQENGRRKERDPGFFASL